MGTIFYEFEWSVSHEEPLQSHDNRGGGKADIESSAGGERLAGINVWTESPSLELQDSAYRNIFSQWDASPHCGLPALELCVLFFSVDAKCRLLQSRAAWILAFWANQSSATTRGRCVLDSTRGRDSGFCVASTRLCRVVGVSLAR